MVPSLTQLIQANTADYRKLQQDYSNAVESRQRLDAQKSENESVQKEFAILTENNKIYKLVGPVLLAQDSAEAKANVNKRLEFIADEIMRVEQLLKDLSDKVDAKKMTLVGLQTQFQQEQQKGAAGIATSS